MKIHRQEIIDGIADIVQTNASIAYCSPTTVLSDTNVSSKIKASSANPNQIDLYYIKSILVSTGWNKNDDVFDPSVTWSARNTPVDKQFNLMHNENNIIGHITGSYVIDRNGNQVNDTQPDDFDIITEAVLYNSWTEPENRQRMEQIIAEIEEGKWFVSMECLFSGFDYALLDGVGNAKFLERNEGSAFLTKHLRAYGGSGEYEGYRIGRSLKDISFSGKGLVSKPANPRSIIIDTSRAFSLNYNSSNILTSFPFNGDNNMSDNNLLEKQLADIQSELASTKEENASLKAKIEAFASIEDQSEALASLQAIVADKDATIATLEASIAEKEAAILELNEILSTQSGEMSKKEEELEKMKTEKKMQSRKAALLDVGLDSEEVDECLASYESFDDNTFDAIIKAMKKMDDKKKAMVKEEKPKAEEVHSEEQALEAAEVALEDVETTEAALVDASNDNEELEATRASVAQWLETHVLSK